MEKVSGMMVAEVLNRPTAVTYQDLWKALEIWLADIAAHLEIKDLDTYQEFAERSWKCVKLLLESMSYTWLIPSYAPVNERKARPRMS